MPRNLSGTYVLPTGNPVVDGTLITALWANTTFNDIASELGTLHTEKFAIDGSSLLTGNLQLNGNKCVGVANATARTDAATLGQLQDSTTYWLTSVTGNNTITATANPTITAYVAGQTFRFLQVVENRLTNVTINIDGLGDKSILRGGNYPLTTAAIPAGSICEIVYDGTNFQLTSWSGSGNGSAKNWVTKTTNYGAYAGDAIAADTSAGGFYITLPINPNVNDQVSILDVGGAMATYNLLIKRNGSLIYGLAEDLNIDVSNLSVVMVYTGSTKGWVAA